MFINIPNKFYCYITLGIIGCGSINFSFADTADQRLAPSGGLPFGAFASELSKTNLVIGPIVIGKDTVDSLFSKFGKSPIAKGDAGSPALICYTSNKTDEPLTVVFEAWGKDAGSELIGFTLLTGTKRNISSGKSSAKCTSTMLVGNALKTESGLGIGLGGMEIKKILGQPLHESRDEMYYAYLSKIPVPADEQSTLPKQTSGTNLKYDVLSIIEVSMKHGRTASISIRRTETF